MLLLEKKAENTVYGNPWVFFLKGEKKQKQLHCLIFPRIPSANNYD